MSELSEPRMMRIVDELAEAAERVGLEVRREKIMREIGYRTRGGACRLREKNLVIIDRDQPAAEQARSDRRSAALARSGIIVPVARGAACRSPGRHSYPEYRDAASRRNQFGWSYRNRSQARGQRGTADGLTFHTRLKERGLKSTGQRDDIARVFFEHGHHISAEELYAEVKKINPHVGYATIYRTLRLLKECALLYERHFDEGQARYEAVGRTSSRSFHLRSDAAGLSSSRTPPLSACRISSRAISA